MANVKITELTELSAANLADADVLPIVDVGADQTKKVTIASIQSLSNANDFVTFTQLNSNLNIVSSNTVAVETRRVANTTAFTNEDTALQARLTTNVNALTTEDTALQARLTTNVSALTTSINTLDANADAIETRRADNVFFTLNLTGQPQANITLNNANVEPTSNNIYSLGAPDKVWKDVFIGPGSLKIGDVTISALGKEGITITGASGDQANVTTPNQGGVSNVSAELDGLQSRLATNVTAFTNEDTAIQARLTTNVTAFTNEDTALQARLTTNVTAFTNEDTALQARLATNVTAFTNEDTALQARLTTNVNTLTTSVNTLDANADAIEARRVANVTVTSTEDAAIEARRVANIAGAVSSITTADLTASRALVSDGSGKVAVSAITSTEIGHLDGVSSAIQTQINAVESRRAANLTSATFTGEVNMGDDLVVTGNLTVNGETTTVNSENKVIQDRFIMLANSVSGAPSADVGILFNRGSSGNAALFYDESAKFFTLSETRDPDNNVVISPTGAANLAVGQFTASTISFNGADLNTAITDNRSGAVSTVYKDNLTASRALVSDGSGKIVVSAITSTEIGHLDGVSSAIQTQLDAATSRIDSNAAVAAANTAAVETRRTNNIAGAVSTITTGDLTASRALVSDGSGKVAVSAVTSTEVEFLDGVAAGTVVNGKLVAYGAAGQLVGTSLAIAADADINGNLVIGTNTSNTLTIVGSVDLGAL